MKVFLYRWVFNVKTMIRVRKAQLISFQRMSLIEVTGISLEFLEYSKGRGNDLITPRHAFGFPGLKAGDLWCICALRWDEARRAGRAPGVKLMSTNIKTLELVELDDLTSYGVDLN